MRPAIRSARAASSALSTADGDALMLHTPLPLGHESQK
jgi:hypothetical protein